MSARDREAESERASRFDIVAVIVAAVGATPPFAGKVAARLGRGEGGARVELGAGGSLT